VTIGRPLPSLAPELGAKVGCDITEVQRVKIAQTKALLDYVLRVEKEIGERAWSILSDQVLARRRRWLNSHLQNLAFDGPPPRSAYRLFFEFYLKIDLAEVLVVFEDDARIVWNSYNFCSMLEACRELGISTRKVCRHSEESLHLFGRAFHPDLRFARNYEHIRPYQDSCMEAFYLEGE
jgi:hypothetical protein